MRNDGNTGRDGSTRLDEAGVPFGSNEVRLSPREWIVVVAIIAPLFCLAPILWQRVERLEAGRDYRIPYSLGNDYWTYSRYCRLVSSRNKTLVIGDSVVWGHYVEREQTLSHYLDEMARGERFANMGVDGIHPAAMAGLIEYYGRAISGKNVVLHCNLLWMCSEKHDLQSTKEFSFNHPRLVPQFFPDIPCYTEPYSGRIGVVIERNLSLYGWTNHLRVAYFGNTDIPAWTIEHPYDSPVRPITLDLPSPDEPPSPEPVAEPWTRKRARRFDAPWVELETSFQWRSFKRTIDILAKRGNGVFVLVGPFNEHMLTEKSLQTYRNMRGEVEARLKARGIPYCIPPALPSDHYADASHPLGDGYAMLAKQLFENRSFVTFAGNAARATDGLQ